MLLRSVIIVALLASLFYLVRHFQPAAEPGNGRVATSQPEKPLPEAAEDEAISGFNPPVTMPLPDVEKGYVFSEKRKIEKEEPGAAAKAAAAVEQGPDPLETVVYSGSLIAGKIRRALVSYQEQAKEAPPRRPSPGRGQAPAAAIGAVQNKQLNQGDRFLGYVLTVVEADRIVFEKGERKVEKFLYDRSKKRAAPPETGRKEAPPPQPAEVSGVPLQALAPPEVIEALMAPPGSRRPSGAVVGGAPGNETAGEAGGTPGGGAIQAPTPASRATRRSQRLLGLDSSIRVPATPVPGRPVPNK